MSRDLAIDMPAERGAACPVTAEALFSEHGAFAWRVLRRLGVAEADVDDACQEVFLTVHRRLPHFEGRSTPRTWLYGICVRVAADHRKKAIAPARGTLCPPPDLVIDAHQEDEVAVREARQLLDRLLDTLDDNKRAVFVLYEIEELRIEEVAAALGCPLQTAYSRLEAARRDVEGALQRLRATEAQRG